jgi:phosphoesterase RecJ-like protein
MEINWEPLREIIAAHQRFTLISHVRPDADAIGSELGMAGLLEAQGKTVRIVNPSAVPDSLLFLDPTRRVHKFGDGLKAEQLADTEVYLIVDTSAWGQLVDICPLLKHTTAKKVVIDHHVSEDDLGATVFKDTSAEATGALIVRLADALGYPITPDIAAPLYCAIATDTGWFRFSSTSAETMRTIGRLVDLGVRPNQIYEKLYEQHSLGRLRLAGVVLGRVTLACEGRLAYTWVKFPDFEETKSRPVDTEDLVNECLKIGGTQSAFIAIEQPNRRIKFSFRSRTELNVAKVAEKWGGGGHRQAAGATLDGPLETAIAAVLEAMTAALAAQ